MDTDPHHRQIDLQSPQDLTYLLTNIKAAAQEKLDLHIPPAPASVSAEAKAVGKGEEDAFRTKVEELVQQYITRTLTLALPSLSINGLSAPSSLLSLSPQNPIPNPNPSACDPPIDDPNYEPYDPRLTTRLRALHATLESETTRVAQLRREAPSRAAMAYLEGLRREMEEEEKGVEGIVGRVGVEGEGEGERGGKELLEGVGGGLGEGVAERWEGAVRRLGALEGVTEGVARLERAGVVVQEVQGL